MVMITAVGLSNKYLQLIGLCFEMLVLRFLSRRSNGTWKPVSGSVADYSVWFEMLRRAYSIVIVMS